MCAPGIELVEIKDLAIPYTSRENYDWIQKRSTCALTKQYCAQSNNVNVAYVAIDWHPLNDGYVRLYELLVFSEYRRRGYGTRILNEVEKAAKKQGYDKVKIRPGEISCDITKEELINWYYRNGYSVSEEDSKVLEKKCSWD